MDLKPNHKKIFITSLPFVLWLILSIGFSCFIGNKISTVFTSTTSAVQNSEEPLSQLQTNVERMKGLQTQFGLFTDFLRFSYTIDPHAILTFTTDNEMVNNGLPNRTGIADLSKCIPNISTSLPIEKVQDQMNLIKQSLSEECIKKTMGVDDKIVKTHFENKSGPFFTISPDKASLLIIYVFSFAFWNALLLLFLNVYRNLFDIAKKSLSTRD